MVIKGKFRSNFQMVRGDRVAVKVGVLYGESGKTEDHMSQGMSSWWDDTSILSGKSILGRELEGGGSDESGYDFQGMTCQLWLLLNDYWLIDWFLMKWHFNFEWKARGRVVIVWGTSDKSIDVWHLNLFLILLSISRRHLKVKEKCVLKQYKHNTPML